MFCGVWRPHPIDFYDQMSANRRIPAWFGLNRPGCHIFSYFKVKKIISFVTRFLQFERVSVVKPFLRPLAPSAKGGFVGVITWGRDEGPSPTGHRGLEI